MPVPRKTADQESRKDRAAEEEDDSEEYDSDEEYDDDDEAGSLASSGLLWGSLAMGAVAVSVAALVALGKRR